MDELRGSISLAIVVTAVQPVVAVTAVAVQPVVVASGGLAGGLLGGLAGGALLGGLAAGLAGGLLGGLVGAALGRPTIYHRYYSPGFTAPAFNNYAYSIPSLPPKVNIIPSYRCCPPMMPTQWYPSAPFGHY